MTREERNTKLKNLITCLKCEESGKECDANCHVQYEAGNMGEIIENLEAISKALEQEPCEDEYIKVPKKALKYRTAGMVAYNAEWLKNHFDIERAVICGEQEPCEDWYDVPSDEMTLEQARQAVKDLRKKLAEHLEQDPCDVFDKYGNYKYPNDVELTEPNTATSMPCEDAISREKTCDYIAEFINHEYSTQSECEMVEAMIDGIQHLPPVNPQPNKEDVHREREQAYMLGYEDSSRKYRTEPCEDAMTRIFKRMWNCRGKHTTSIDKVKMEQILRDELPSVNQEPCEDAISRSDMLDAIGHGTTYTSEDLQTIINALPSVNSQPKIGHWINLEKKYKGQKLPFWGRYECSKCGGYGEGTFKYCPNCGSYNGSD